MFAPRESQRKTRSAWLGGRFAETCGRWLNLDAAGPLPVDSSRDKRSCLSQPPPGGSHDVRAAFNAAFLRPR